MTRYPGAPEGKVAKWPCESCGARTGEYHGTNCKWLAGTYGDPAEEWTNGYIAGHAAARAAASGPDLRAALANLPSIRLTGRDLSEASRLLNATVPDSIFVDWDEHEDFVPLSAVSAALATAAPSEPVSRERLDVTLDQLDKWQEEAERLWVDVAAHFDREHTKAEHAEFIRELGRRASELALSLWLTGHRWNEATMRWEPPTRYMRRLAAPGDAAPEALDVDQLANAMRIVGTVEGYGSRAEKVAAEYARLAAPGNAAPSEPVGGERLRLLEEVAYRAELAWESLRHEDHGHPLYDLGRALAALLDTP